VRTTHELSTSQEGRKRLERVIAEHLVEIDEAVLDSRVVVWPADLALPSLGLSADAFNTLAHSVDHTSRFLRRCLHRLTLELEQVSAIYHCGAVVNWLHTYETLRAPNVLGTLALLRLGTHKCSRARAQCARGLRLFCLRTSGTTGRSKRFHHVSTIGVGDTREGDEDSMWPAEWLSALSGYSLSKVGFTPRHHTIAPGHKLNACVMIPVGSGVFCARGGGQRRRCSHLSPRHGGTAHAYWSVQSRRLPQSVLARSLSISLSLSLPQCVSLLQ
jgi:hypothetical protein